MRASWRSPVCTYVRYVYVTAGVYVAAGVLRRGGEGTPGGERQGFAAKKIKKKKTKKICPAKKKRTHLI